MSCFAGGCGPWKKNGTVSYWEVIFKATSFADLLSRIDFINEIMDYDERVIQDLKDLQAQLAEEKSALEESKAALEEAKQELSSRKAGTAGAAGRGHCPDEEDPVAERCLPGYAGCAGSGRG